MPNADGDVDLGPAAAERFAAISTGRLGRAALLRILHWARLTLDAGLATPAPWWGPSRNAHAAASCEAARWLEPAFATAVEVGLGGSEKIAPADLLRMSRVVGGPGGWRTTPVRVDGHRVRFRAGRVLGLVEQLTDRASLSTEPAPLVAARLHLGLLLVHPFSDGNGRTARLAAATVLLRDGTRNSLQTCVEQHRHIAPHRYAIVMGRLRRQEIDIDHVIDDFLGAMAGRCVLAAWACHRKDDPVALARLDRVIAAELDSQLAVVGRTPGPREAWRRP